MAGAEGSSKRGRRGERMQGPAGGRRDNNRRGRTGWGSSGMAAWQGRERGEEDDLMGEDDGGGGAWAIGPRLTGKQRRIQGGEP